MIRFAGVWLRGSRGPIVESVSFELPRGGFGVLHGPTGGGKTTILRLAHFDRRPDRGTVVVAEHRSDLLRLEEVPGVRRQIGFIFQDYKLLRDRSAFDNVALALAIGGVSARQVRRRVLDLLGQVGLGAKRNASPMLLSGGEQQRLSIARALAFDPHVLLADEPTGNLDRRAAGDVMRLIQRINDRGTTVLMATHNLELVSGHGYSSWLVDEGRVQSTKPL